MAMSPLSQNTSINSEGFTPGSSLSFAPPSSQKPASYELEVNHATALRLEQLSVEEDQDGNFVAATYSSGAFYRRHNLYVILKAANNSLWMGDRFGGWHPLD